MAPQAILWQCTMLSNMEINIRYAINDCSIVRLIFKSKNTVHNRFIMQPKNMGNYFHLRTKRYYHNYNNWIEWGQVWCIFKELYRLRPVLSWKTGLRDLNRCFFLFRYCSKPKCHLSSKICCVFLHIFRWILVCRLVGLRIVVNSFAIFFCSLMPKQRARLHLGRLPGNPEVVIGLYIGAMVYCSHPPNMVCASSW